MDNTLSELDYEFIEIEVKRKIQTIFGPVLDFGFIFGSVAKRYAQRTHDIDVFICLTERMPETEKLFLAWLVDLHKRFGMEVDRVYPAEIVTYSQIRSLIQKGTELEFCLGKNEIATFDCAVWIQALADKKCAVVDNNNHLREFEEICRPIPELWCQQISKLVQTADPVTILRKVLKYEDALPRDIGFTKSDNFRIPPKSQRLEKFIETLSKTSPSHSGLEAYAKICSVLNMLEDEIFSINEWSLPRSFATGATTDRLYPPQPDNFEDVPNWPGVTNMVLKKEFVFISRGGAIEIQKDDGSSERGNPYHLRNKSVIFVKPDANGHGVWVKEEC